MPRRLTFLLLLAGCAPSDLASGPCGPDGEYCESDGVNIEVINHFLDLDPERDVVVARGGLVELFVDDGGAAAFDLTAEITGGELVRLDGRYLTVRALEDEVLVEVDLDRWSDYIFIESREVGDVGLMPVEDQFYYGGPPPDAFALARDAFLSVVVQLVGGETRLYDSTLRTIGPAAGPAAFGDVIVVNGTIDPIDLTVSSDSADRAFAIPFAGDVTSIEVVEAPLLDDPREPIVFGNRLIRVCFTAMADGLPVAGLAWRIRGPGIDSDEACAVIRQIASGPLTVEVAGLSRTFDLEVVVP